MGEPCGVGLRGGVGGGGGKSYPNVEVEVFVGDGFNIEAYGGYCSDNFADLRRHGSVSFALCVLDLDKERTVP